MDVNHYLARFNASFWENSLQNLAHLQAQHMRNVPFENLDVIRKEPIYLNVERIYKKIVNDRRGGYCYEVNGLFQWLLSELGYEACLIPATVMRPTGNWAKENTHATILVRLEGQLYLADVGFGDSHHHPILLDGTEQTDVSGTYKVVKQEEQLYDLMRKQDANTEWQTLYRFNATKWNLVDFHEGCVFNQVSKDSTFTKADLVTIATADGRITLRDHTLTITKNGIQEKRELNSTEKVQVLENAFGIYIKHQ